MLKYVLIMMILICFILLLFGAYDTEQNRKDDDRD